MLPKIKLASLFDVKSWKSLTAHIVVKSKTCHLNAVIATTSFALNIDCQKITDA